MNKKTVLLFSLFLVGCSQTQNKEIQSSTETQSVTTTQSATTTQTTTSNLTRQQRNAVDKAKSYLSHTPFSKEGLYNQLLFEKFNESDARFAVDNIDVNWNEQALKKAKSYLSHSSFSDEGLKKQLEFEKFTPEQIDYAMKNLD